MNHVLRRVASLGACALLSLVSLDLSAESYQYDGSGRLLGVTYDDGSNITYTYDAAGRIIGQTVVPSSVVGEDDDAGDGRDTVTPTDTVSPSDGSTNEDGTTNEDGAASDAEDGESGGGDGGCDCRQINAPSQPLAPTRALVLWLATVALVVLRRASRRGCA